MRILRVADIPKNRTGGMSRVIYCTGDILVSMGHQVEYLVKEDLPGIGSASFRRRFTVPLQIPRLVRKLAKQGKQYDVIEIHEELAGLYCFVRKIWRDLPPVVIASQGIQERHRLAELAYRRQKCLPISLSLRCLRITVLQSMYSVRHGDCVVCSNSEDTAYLQKVGVPQDRVIQNHNGVEPEFILAGKAVAESDLSRSGILFLGTWILRKGTLDLVPAVSEVLKRHSWLKFTVAGCGCKAESVLAEFDESLHSRIKIIPKLSTNEELLETYRQNSILVLPSYFEGQPLTMLEAAAMGLAIVTTNICGMADFIENGVNGITLPVGDVASLVKSLDCLVENKTLARSLGDAARQKVEEYTWNNATEKLAQAYYKAMENDCLKN